MPATKFLFRHVHALRKKRLLLAVAVFLGYASHLSAQSAPSLQQRCSLSLHIGSWQPHSLNDEPKLTTFGAAGATPSVKAAFTLPVGSGTGIEFSCGYWALRDLAEIEQVHSLTLIPFSLNLKHWLIPDYFLSAYVIYGASMYRGSENETVPFEKTTTANGWGINLGAGIDMTLFSHIGTGVSFTYHYARFGSPIGGVDDFSGPCISGKIFWIF